MCADGPAQGRLQVNSLDAKMHGIDTTVRLFDCSPSYASDSTEVVAPSDASNAIVTRWARLTLGSRSGRSLSGNELSTDTQFSDDRSGSCGHPLIQSDGPHRQRHREGSVRRVAIYVVDDCCPDHSGAFVEANVALGRVRVIVHAHNQGVGGAVMTGYDAAIADGAHVIVKVDGDGQMDPSSSHTSSNQSCPAKPTLRRGIGSMTWNRLVRCRPRDCSATRCCRC